MPRKARIDAAGALHHIIVRGIERCKIFCDGERPELVGSDLIRSLGGWVAAKAVWGAKTGLKETNVS